MASQTKTRLLSIEQDAKTSKGSKKGYLTGVLYLAPAEEAQTGYNLCPMASDECKRACLYGAGMAGVFPTIKAARVKKTRDYIVDPKAFVERLRADIRSLVRLAKSRGMIPAVRVNGTSDIPKLAMRLAREFPNVQFYDYTKIPRPYQRVLPNYHLTFSFSGTNLEQCLESLEQGVNVAVVFPTADMPPTWHGYHVVNGDESDLRFLDARGVIVGLKAKGDARKLAAGGFVQIAAV